MTKEEAKPGQIVQVISGGPKMTIDYFDNYSANCIWFLNGTPHAKEFPFSVLQTVSADEGFTLI